MKLRLDDLLIALEELEEDILLNVIVDDDQTLVEIPLEIAKNVIDRTLEDDYEEEYED